jgi:hypothetical protein
MNGNGDSLVPLVDCVVVNECRFDLNGAEESVIFNIAVIDIECDR